MTSTETVAHENYPDPHHDVYSKTIFGFWVYLLTDFVLFGVLFAAYAVLRNHTFGGPSAHDLFNLSFTLTQTLILLVSSFIIGLANACAHRNKRGWTIGLYIISFWLGLAFLAMELHEFTSLVKGNHGWDQSAFLSAFFTLVGTHIAHMMFALLWVIVLIIPVCYHGIKQVSVKRLTCLKMFWQFLNVIWLFIFTIVYLLGVNLI